MNAELDKTKIQISTILVNSSTNSNLKLTHLLGNLRES